jgi:hypothetical protein
LSRQFQRFADPSSEKVPFFVCIVLTFVCYERASFSSLGIDKQSKLEKVQTGEQMRARVYAYSYSDTDFLSGGFNVKILN